MTKDAQPIFPSNPSESKVCNVLILGETQAGKSTFVQAVKQYANPSHKIEKDTIGNGNVSMTKDVHISCVDMNYPLHEVLLETPPNPGNPTEPPSYSVVNIDALMEENMNDWEGYETSLDCRSNKTLHRCDVPEGEAMHHIHLFDTPGLNDTNGDDEVHIASIIKSLQDVGGIHLVLVIVGDGPFTEGSQSALKSYMEVFPKFQGIVTFVHTKFDYAKLHPLRKDKLESMNERKDILNSIMGRGSCRHIVIDCDFETTKPIRRYITLNTIRQILLQARTNLPVFMDAERVFKTSKMKTVDRIIYNKYRATLDAGNRTLESKNTLQGHALQDIAVLNTAINTIEATIVRELAYTKAVCTTEPVLIDEQAFPGVWRAIDWFRRKTLTFPAQAYPIRYLVITNDNMKIEGIRGGLGFNFCEIDFKRDAYRNGLLTAKYYTMSLERYKDDISRARERLDAAVRDRPMILQDLNDYKETNSSLLQEIKVLQQTSKLGTDMTAKAEEPSVSIARFLALVSSGVYSKDHAEAAIEIEKIYLQEVVEKVYLQEVVHGFSLLELQSQREE
ncbi:hypothetical protein EMPS_10465 [Entomortierella parvispora]|uniref:G domain-containing protein n=1 Tax=Entomortierella parvispora TaxID=205924 RepID=A0A9P3HK47_9FUNG|nr:hypothetical protein EMPS_10465 [Entomortierella parvispora]